MKEQVAKDVKVGKYEHPTISFDIKMIVNKIKTKMKRK